MYVCVPHACLVPEEFRRGHQIPGFLTGHKAKEEPGLSDPLSSLSSVGTLARTTGLITTTTRPPFFFFSVGLNQGFHEC